VLLPRPLLLPSIPSRTFVFVLTSALFAALNLAGQAQPESSAKKWSVPRTPDGQPDLQGVWTNATVTPLQRPAQLGTKEFFTAEEAAAFEKQRIQQGNADLVEGERGAADLARRAYNNFWTDRGTSVGKTMRTSLIMDPPDGRVPPFTPEAQKKFDAARAELALHPVDGPEDRPLTERCILFGAAGPPMLPEPYNNNYEIVQSRGFVAIAVEMNHENRIIPVDGSPHLPPQIRQWTGDSRGHWEGDTLVVDSTNFSDKTNFRGPPLTARQDIFSSPELHVIERFTRISDDTIVYRFTVDDPGTWTKPWSGEMLIHKTKGPIFEYACHEGNYGLTDILEGARKAEKKRSN